MQETDSEAVRWHAGDCGAFSGPTPERGDESPPVMHLKQEALVYPTRSSGSGSVLQSYVNKGKQAGPGICAANIEQSLESSRDRFGLLLYGTLLQLDFSKRQRLIPR